LHVEVLRAGLVGGDERQVDVGLHRVDSSHFAFSRGLFEPLEAIRSVRRSIPCPFRNSVGQVVDHALVEVLAAEEGVTVWSPSLEDAIADLEDGDVEGPTAEDRNAIFSSSSCRAVGERTAVRSVDDAEDGETGDLPASLGGVPLAVVEVGGTVITPRSPFSPR